MSIGNYPEIMSQRIWAGIILVERLGVYGRASRVLCETSIKHLQGGPTMLAQTGLAKARLCIITLNRVYAYLCQRSSSIPTWTCFSQPRLSQHSKSPLCTMKAVVCNANAVCSLQEKCLACALTVLRFAENSEERPRLTTN